MRYYCTDRANSTIADALNKHIHNIGSALKAFIDGYARAMDIRSNSGNPWQFSSTDLVLMISELSGKAKQVKFRKTYPKGGPALAAYYQLAEDLEELRNDARVLNALNFDIPVINPGRGRPPKNAAKILDTFLAAGREWDYKEFLRQPNRDAIIFDEDDEEDLDFDIDELARLDDDYLSVSSRGRNEYEDWVRYTGDPDYDWIERSKRKQRRSRRFNK